MAAVGQIDNILHRRDVLRVFLQIEELAQLKVRREPHITDPVPPFFFLLFCVL